VIITKYLPIILLLTAGFLTRLFAFEFIEMPFANDVRTFQFWAIQLAENGFRAFYAADFFSDYPPAYMYVLFVVGLFRGTAFFDIATFLPAILADVAIAFVIYKIAVKAAPEKVSFALLAAAAWLFNPAIILISSIWGQVESVFVLVLLVSLVLLREKKLLSAYILFAVAILIKPQSLFLGPVYLFSVYDFFASDTRPVGRRILYFVGSLFAGAGAMLLISWPFGLEATARQLWYGMDSYNFASVNAFNFWAMVGGNWTPLDAQFFGITYGTWGVAIALFIIFAALTALYIDKRRNDGKNFFLIVAALFILIFAFSVKMHERYLFPGLLFLVVYWLENRDRREFILYWAFSAVFFINCLEILRWAGAGFDWTLLAASSIQAVPYVTVFLAIALIFLIVRNVKFAPKELSAGREPADSGRFSATGETISEATLGAMKNPPPMRRRDYAFLAALIAVYATLALTNLGDIRTPQTTWIAESDNNVAHFDFGENIHVAEFGFLMGGRNHFGFDLHFAPDDAFDENLGAAWEFGQRFSGGDVFAWHFTPLDFHARYAVIVAQNGLRLQEVSFRCAAGEIIQIAGWSDGAENLIDEQHLVPRYRYFMNSTYFDEIYHPRTGYEFAHGLAVFETTHPPLGKVFMSWSIRAFGMTPFAWRLPGTLFGIAMIPLLYAFARLLLKSNNYALFAAIIFTFDFMLFSHTRLATIDTFVTFFVIAMYFCMYAYTRKPSLWWLAICGAATGLAIASKWQGFYAALGLPILFFPTLWKIYLRDKKYALITFASCFGFFISLPLVIYVLSYIPFVNAQGGGGLQTIWNNQTGMLGYHSYYVLGAEHPFASPWWSWPLNEVPLWQYRTIVSDTVRRGMSSMGNPAVWWFGIFATGFAIFSLAKKRAHESDTMFLLVAYAVNFLPWVFVTRLTFIYHYFPSVPFVVLLVALFFRHHVKRDWVCFAYAGVVCALFVLFFPVLSGMEVSVAFVEQFLRWPGFDRWFFV